MNLQDVLDIEGGAASDEEYFSALQRAINSGTGWSMQGSYGRAMMEAITDGRCMLGTVPCRDYYGNRIPSRFEVQEGTKGSRQYVIDRCGEDWADLMEAVNVRLHS